MGSCLYFFLISLSLFNFVTLGGLVCVCVGFGGEKDEHPGHPFQNKLVANCPKQMLSNEQNRVVS